MPELPEVEVVRAGLDKHVVGRSFASVDVLHPRAVRSHVGGDLSSLLDATLIRSARRRGKFLWLELSREVDGVVLEPTEALVVHLGMSGQMLVTAPNEVTSTHLRIRAQLSGDVDLNFVDQRTFGRWELVSLVEDPHGEYPAGVPASAVHIAQDPLEKTFDIPAVAKNIKRRQSAIKQVLLNQEVISGVGNIYADEALWAAGVRPRRKAAGVSGVGVEKIIKAATEVMERALEAGGTSFDSLYVNVNGASGYFSRNLNVYGREGQPCPRCATPIKRVVVGGRSSHFCPTCQH